MRHPIWFSIPSELVVDQTVPAADKTDGFAQAQPNFGGTAGWTISDPTEYYHGYARSLYGLTSKKAGWDCLRHYEILMNGCVPYFTDLEAMPSSTMVSFPRQLVRAAMQLPGIDAQNRTVDREIFADHEHRYDRINRALLEHTRCLLTTEATAQYVLDTLGTCRPKSVLFLSGDVRPDYQRCTLLHGLKSLLGSDCVDVPRIDHLYSDYPADSASQLYGRGFSYARFLDPVVVREDLIDRGDIPERLRHGEFELVIYGSAHRGLPFHDQVVRTYPSDRIAYVCGEDTHDCTLPSEWRHVFVRERR